MAREKMITRTVKMTECEILCVHVTTETTEKMTVKIPGEYKSNEKLLNAVRAVVEVNTLKVVHVLSSKLVNTRYGVSETDFLSIAVNLDEKEEN